MDIFSINEKRIKRNEHNLRDLQDNIKRYNIRIIGVFLHSLSRSMDPPELIWFKNSHSTNADNEGAEWSEEELRLWGLKAWLPPPALLCDLGEVIRLL